MLNLFFLQIILSGEPTHTTSKGRNIAPSYNSEGSVSHINGVWPVLSVEQLFAVINFHPPDKIEPTIGPPTSAFFLAETRVRSEFRTVMSELESLVKKLSDKFDGLQDDLEKLKSRSEKRKSMGSGAIPTGTAQGHDLGAVRTTGTGHTLGESIDVLHASDLGADRRHHLGA